MRSCREGESFVNSIFNVFDVFAKLSKLNESVCLKNTSEILADFLIRAFHVFTIYFY